MKSAYAPTTVVGMTIPRQLGPETGPRSVLPDYSRSNATVERMVANLDGPQSAARGRVLRTLAPAHAQTDILIRGGAATVLGAGSIIAIIAVVALLLGVEEGHAPGIGLLLVVLVLGLLALVLALLALRFAVVALATYRSSVDVTETGLRIQGALGSRTVPWHDILAIESRVIHPVHWLTVAVRRQDGGRVIMPAFDRHIWQYGAPTGEDVRGLRRELHRRTHGAR